MKTRQEFKEWVKMVWEINKQDHPKMKISEAYELIAKKFGYKDWNTMSAMHFNTEKETK